MAMAAEGCCHWLKFPEDEWEINATTYYNRGIVIWLWGVWGENHTPWCGNTQESSQEMEVDLNRLSHRHTSVIFIKVYCRKMLCFMAIGWIKFSLLNSDIHHSCSQSMNNNQIAHGTFNEQKQKEDLTLNAVKVNFKAWAQLWIPHFFKLLRKSDESALKRFMPLDLCSYCSGVRRFTVAVHPDTWICCKLIKCAHFSPFELLAVCFTDEMQRHRSSWEEVVAQDVSLSSAGLNWTEFTSLFQTMFITAAALGLAKSRQRHECAPPQGT